MNGSSDIRADAPESSFDVRVLSSGSDGNCVFVRAGQTRLLMDAGISRRRITSGLWEIGEELDAVDAILITHEHADHIHALTSVMAKHPHIPVYCTAGTAARVSVKGDAFGAPRIQGGVAYSVVGVRVTVFSTSHDAAEPVGFRLDAGGFSFAYVTDLGEVTDKVENAVEGVQAMLLEANHDEKMLWGGRYPARLKRRVASAKGHLSNRQAGQFLRRVAGPQLTTVVLGHLSASNNDPALAVDTVASHLDGMDISLSAAARKTAGDLMRFRACESPVVVPSKGQLNLF